MKKLLPIALILASSVSSANLVTDYIASDVHEGIREKASQCHIPVSDLSVKVNAGYYSRPALIAVAIKEAFPMATIIKSKRIAPYAITIKFMAWPDRFPLCITLLENGRGH